MRASGETVLVTGATGLIGSCIVSRLLAQKIHVRILTRGTSQPLPFDGNARIVTGDITDGAAIDAALDGCTGVFHCAAEMRRRDLMWPVNVEGTMHLLDACVRRGVSRVVHLSSAGVMGARINGIVDENFTSSPRTEYERTKYEAEKMVSSYAAKHSFAAAVLRPTIVFGQRRGQDSMLAWMRAIRKVRFSYVLADAWANYIYRDDVADACIRAYAHNAKGVFIISDSCRMESFVRAVAGAIGAPPPRRLPYACAFIAAVIMQAYGICARRPAPFTIGRLRALSSRTYFSSEKIRAMLGWHPGVGYREGLRRTVAWYRAQSLL